jgi:hypothetical protein
MSAFGGEPDKAKIGRHVADSPKADICGQAKPDGMTIGERIPQATAR